jgi:molybdenum cofactor biosynthesis protein B
VAVHEHKRLSKPNLKVGVITASDSRTPETDSSGQLIRERLEAEGHTVAVYEIVPDSAERIASAVLEHLPALDAIIVNGGTGIAARDVTIEALRPLLKKELEGFGEIFRALSYQEIGAAAMLSRALAGVRDGKFIAALPGSTAGCRLAMEKLIVPEIGHIAYLLSQ